jgi:hypothetical protein
LSEGLPDKNLFMMCSVLNTAAVRSLPPGFHIRKCREDELGIWMDFPFDDPVEAEKYRGFMTSYFQNVYADKKEVFFDKCLFVCDSEDRPIGTCFAWKAYEKITTIHWFKVLKQEWWNWSEEEIFDNLEILTSEAGLEELMNKYSKRDEIN